MSLIQRLSTGQREHDPTLTLGQLGRDSALLLDTIDSIAFSARIMISALIHPLEMTQHLINSVSGDLIILELRADTAF